MRDNKNSIHLIKNKSDLKLILRNSLDNNVELFHGQGIWQYNTHKMSRFARKNNIPYIISVRGMLESWSLSQKNIKKTIALFLYQRKDLNQASIIHVTSQSEHDQIRKLGFKNPIAIIPNGIDLKNYNHLYPKKIVRPRKFFFYLNP